MEGQPVEGITGINILPLNKKSLITADLTFCAVSIDFEAKIGKLTINFMNGSRQVFERIRKDPTK